MTILNWTELSILQFIFFFAGALLTGIARTGIFGVMLMVVPFLSLIMDGKDAAGLILPLMIAGDFVAAFIYRMTFNKNAAFQILPWILAGVFLGVLVGGSVSNRLFKIVMAGTTFTCAGFVIWNEFNQQRKPKLKIWMIAVIGILSGFASMIGNAAGPIIAVYFLALRLEKLEYVSSIVWLFWVVNIVKLPFHIFVWETIDCNVLKTDLLSIPALLAGLAAGVWVLKRIPEKPFRIVVLVSIFIAGIMLLIP
ncbi:MAG: sulfite exporter TauE/SafE family protein [Deltaproteobacteria bacterium]|jgi:uncharacterized protein|nr:sulfite exporter TauE/SafE family protein [Deltaproteobacteria bacterium]MBT4526474.1 sulfite exporter TauE/SafE family protein [Deltaproteobacteria bacterium]